MIKLQRTGLSHTKSYSGPIQSSLVCLVQELGLGTTTKGTPKSTIIWISALREI